MAVTSPILVPRHRSPWAVPLSVMAHIGLVAALVLGVAWKSEPPAALQAELWEAIPSSPSPAPTTPETPTPPLATPQVALKPAVTPAPAKIAHAEPEAIAPKVIKKPIKKPEPEPEPEPEAPKKATKPPPKVQPKAEPKIEPKPKPVVKAEAKAEIKPDAKPDASAREADRAKAVARMNQLSQGAGLGGASTLGTPQAGSAQGLGQGWGAKLKACVQPNLRYSDTSGENPRVVFLVKLSPVGTPSDPVISKSSGNAAFDAAVSRALLRCDPFPKPETGGYPASVTVAYRLND